MTSMQMEKSTVKNDAASLLKKHKKSIIFGLIVIAALLLLTVIYSITTQPERSIANFCKVAKENKSSLLSGANNEQSLDVYKKLEAVAPNDIRPDITTIRKGYETIVQDPSTTISAGLGMSASESRRTDYINKNCTDF